MVCIFPATFGGIFLQILEDHEKAESTSYPARGSIDVHLVGFARLKPVVQWRQSFQPGGVKLEGARGKQDARL